jgi:hypothetical protein
MKIEIKYPKLANLYSFVSNLSQWNKLVCVPERKKEWIQRTGGLSQKEKKYLEEFSQIFQKAEINLEPVFLFENSKKVWLIVSKKIGKINSSKIQLIFKIFGNRFKKIWDKENKKLKILAQELIKRKPQINHNLEIIKKLCGLTKQRLPQKIKVILLLSSGLKEDCQGWAFKGKVALECSGWPIKRMDYLINNIFVHECFHILFKKNKKLFSAFKSIVNKNRQFINKIGLEKWTPEIIFEEALISSFLPEGYLSEKNFKINSRKITQREIAKKKVDDFTKLRNFCALHLYDLAKKYVDDSKSLDKFYFEKVTECIRDFFLQKNQKRKG